MREILFSGKRKDSGAWVEGFLVKDTAFYGMPENHAYIVNHGHPSGCFGGDIYVEVEPDTVGQYTGLTDKNGTKIFEGNVVRAVIKASKSTLPFEWPAAPVVYKGSSFGLAYKSNFGFVRLDGFAPTVTLEVIGNVHDNPELKEV